MRAITPSSLSLREKEREREKDEYIRIPHTATRYSFDTGIPLTFAARRDELDNSREVSRRLVRSFPISYLRLLRNRDCRAWELQIRRPS